MKTYPNVNYDFRPESYWTEPSPLAAILKNVKGTARRAIITAHWKQGQLEALSDTLLQTELSSAQRRSLGRIHPGLMGGEYLPRYAPGEVEIARIQLRSTTGDVISIRATPLKRARMALRAVDEYPESWTLLCRPQEASRPLTLGQLIQMIDTGEQTGAGLAGGFSLGYNNCNAKQCDRESLRHFTSITSHFYPQLEEHYKYVLEDWVREDDQEPGAEEQES